MVNSLVWTADEAKYLKAIFRWQETSPSVDEDEKRRQQEAAAKRELHGQQPAGELRILVIGGKGTGKTAILDRFSQGFPPGAYRPPDPFEHGCRRRITLEVSPTPAPNVVNDHLEEHANRKDQRGPRVHTQTYVINAVEMPSKHLLSNPVLAEALSNTDAAVLVYSVRDAASFRLAQGLAEFVREHFAQAAALPSRSSPISSSPSSLLSPCSPRCSRSRSRRKAKSQSKPRRKLKPRPRPKPKPKPELSSSLSNADTIAGSRRGAAPGTGASTHHPTTPCHNPNHDPIINTNTNTIASTNHNNNTDNNNNNNEDNHHHHHRRIYPLVLVGNKTDPPTCGPDADPVAILQEERAISRAAGFAAAQAMGMMGTGTGISAGTGMDTDTNTDMITQGRSSWWTPPPPPASSRSKSSESRSSLAVPFLEVSALTGEGVEEAFRVAGREALRALKGGRAETYVREGDAAGSGGDGGGRGGAGAGDAVGAAGRDGKTGWDAGLAAKRVGTGKDGEGRGGRKRFRLWRVLSQVFVRRQAVEGR